MDRGLSTARVSYPGAAANRYKLQWYWWEEVELARKIMLTGFFALIGPRDEASSFVRLIFATVLSTVYAVLVALVQPFKRFEVMAAAGRGQPLTVNMFWLTPPPRHVM